MKTCNHLCFLWVIHFLMFPHHFEKTERLCFSCFSITWRLISMAFRLISDSWQFESLNRMPNSSDGLTIGDSKKYPALRARSADHRVDGFNINILEIKSIALSVIQCFGCLLHSRSHRGSWFEGNSFWRTEASSDFHFGHRWHTSGHWSSVGCPHLLKIAWSCDLSSLPRKNGHRRNISARIQPALHISTLVS